MSGPTARSPEREDRILALARLYCEKMNGKGLKVRCKPCLDAARSFIFELEATHGR